MVWDNRTRENSTGAHLDFCGYSLDLGMGRQAAKKSKFEKQDSLVMAASIQLVDLNSGWSKTFSGPDGIRKASEGGDQVKYWAGEGRNYQNSVSLKTIPRIIVFNISWILTTYSVILTYAFICIISFNSYNGSMRLALLFDLLHRRGNWSSDRLSNLSQVTEVTSGKGKVQTQDYLILKPKLSNMSKITRK